MKCSKVSLNYWLFFTIVKSCISFEISINCSKDISKCYKEELEYISISELHDQIDDDKNGSIDISESNDFVKETLTSSGGAAKANKFHKNDDQIDKQDLWHIWRTSKVSNWTTNDLLKWLSDDVNLPQYTNIFIKRNLNGSSLPRLTGDDYLANVVGISNSIHRKKIVIKAVDVVLFGYTKKLVLSIHMIIISIILFAILTIFFLIQMSYSKQYVKNMQKKLDYLGETENSLSELRSRIKEADDFKLKKNAEVQEKEERHQLEINSTKNLSDDNICADSERLQDANKEIIRLKAALVDSKLQINKLTNKLMGHFIAFNDTNDGQFLQSLLQLTHAVERQYLAEKIACLDRQSMEFKELNEKVKKRKSGFMGSFRLIHTNELDELEKGFAATKKAYETLIHEKNEQESRWSKLENITGLNLMHCGDVSNINEVIRWTANESHDHEQTASAGQFQHVNTENVVHKTNPSNHEGSEENLLKESSYVPSSKKLSSKEMRSTISQNSVDSSSTSSFFDDQNVNMRSIKVSYEQRKPSRGVGHTRIASLNRSSMKKT